MRGVKKVPHVVGKTELLNQSSEGHPQQRVGKRPEETGRDNLGLIK